MRYGWFLLVAFILSGCAINPVTGNRELALVSEGQEVSIGTQQYLPSRQMQGGDYVVDPEITAYVSTVGQKLARVSDRKLPYEFVVLNNSQPNAWSLPGGKIALNRGLLVELNDEAELAAVLGHEIVHAAARHQAKGMERGILLQGAVLAAGIASQGNQFANAVVGSASVAAGLVNSKYGRDAERESDYYGMLYMSRAGYDPQAAVRLQQTFVELSKKRQSNWLEGLFASHPPSEERVAANRETARTLPGTVRNREQFQQKMAALFKNREAYDAYDAGEKALQDGQHDKAMSLADKALAKEPREGLFHSLKGDVFYTQKKYRDAVANYDRAISANSNFFYYYLQRGLSYFELKEVQNSNSDLEKSVKLLPTSSAYNTLGKIQLTWGNKERAKQYFAAAAESDSGSGKEAFHSLVRLDLPDNPGNYLKSRALVDDSGRVLVEIVNPTPAAVTEVVVRLVVPDGRGGASLFDQRISDIIAAGSAFRVNTGLRGPAGAQVGASVIEAEVMR